MNTFNNCFWFCIAAALVLTACAGCATKADLEFVDADGTSFRAVSKAGPFGELDTTNQRLGYIWLGDGSGEINVGQDAQGLSNAGQVDALRSVNETAVQLLPAVLQLGQPPLPTSDAFPSWLRAVQALTGGDGALLSAILRLLGV